MKINVRCIFVIPVEVPDNYVKDEHLMYFDIEENHCPGTGLVGAALDKHIKEHDQQKTCWACALNGECEVV